MSDSKSTSRIIDQLNEQTAEACGADSTETAQIMRDLGAGAKTTMLSIVSAYQDNGFAAVTTLSTYLQVCIQFLRHACPDGPVVPMLRALADLEDARQCGAPPDPALQAELQRLGVALTLSARRRRQGQGGLQ